MVSFWAFVVALLLVLLAASSLPQTLWRFYKKCKAMRSIPGWPTHWFWGNLHQLTLDQATMMKMLAYVQDNRLKVTRIWFGPVIPAVMVTHCSLVQNVMKLPKDRRAYNCLIPWLGSGLVTAEGKKWFRDRRLLTPAFHYNILKGYVPVTYSCLEIFMEKWSTCATDGVPVCTFQDLSSLTLDILMQSAFSSETNCQKLTTDHRYVKAVKDLSSLTYRRIKNPLYIIESLYYLSTEGKDFKQACERAHEYTDSVIAQRKEALGIDSARPNGGKEVVLDRSKKYLDFLNILLMAEDEDGEGMTDKEIRDEVDTFMFAGYHTTTSSMSWTLYCLARHPEHQDRIREEMKNVLMGREQLEYDDLKDLKYLTWCIKEALRLYPPTLTIARSTTDNIDIEGHVIPKDVMVLIEIFHIHRHPDTWENPNEYNPLRFHPSNAEGRHPYAFIPFSAGNRNCIGQHFALTEERIILASIIDRFQVSLDETHEVEIEPQTVLQAKNDIKLKLKLI